jgi:preprotein translocase subunit YajC
MLASLLHVYVSSVLAAFAPILLAGQPAGDGGGLEGILFGFVLPMAAIFAVFYFFVIRPQRKRQQQHEEMVEKIKKGDQIVTIGGIHGTVKRIDSDSVLAQVDSNGVKLRIDKQAIASVGGSGQNDE